MSRLLDSAWYFNCYLISTHWCCNKCAFSRKTIFHYFQHNMCWKNIFINTFSASLYQHFSYLSTLEWLMSGLQVHHYIAKIQLRIWKMILVRSYSTCKIIKILGHGLGVGGQQDSIVPLNEYCSGVKMPKNFTRICNHVWRPLEHAQE